MLILLQPETCAPPRMGTGEAAPNRPQYTLSQQQLSYRHYIVSAVPFTCPDTGFTTILNVHCSYKNVSTRDPFSFSKRLFLYSPPQHPPSHTNPYFIENSILPLTLPLFQTYLHESIITSFLPICERGYDPPPSLSF